MKRFVTMRVPSVSGPSVTSLEDPRGNLETAQQLMQRSRRAVFLGGVCSLVRLSRWCTWRAGVSGPRKLPGLAQGCSAGRGQYHESREPGDSRARGLRPTSPAAAVCQCVYALRSGNC